MEDNIKVTKYAPVFVPTLCRSEHFIKLLESLERCTWSEFTEVHVSLDYPPSEKFEAGHRIIDEYLQRKEAKNGFKHLYVYRQSENLGVMGNFLFLEKLRARFDRFILSEDDNVFSPNFLMFINKGLELYKDNPTIIAINGYTHPFKFYFSDNSYFLFNNNFSAWGYGTWNSKIDVIEKDIKEGGFRKSLSFSNILKVKKHGLIHLNRYILYSLSRHPQNILLYDTVLSLYMIIFDKCVICPKVSTVRNEGWDNSGNSTSYIERNLNKEEQIMFSKRHMNQIIDTNNSFIFTGDPLSYFDYNNNLAARESSDRINCREFFISLSKSFRAFLKKVF